MPVVMGIHRGWDDKSSPLLLQSRRIVVTVHPAGLAGLRQTLQRCTVISNSPQRDVSRSQALAWKSGGGLPAAAATFPSQQGDESSVHEHLNLFLFKQRALCRVLVVTQPLSAWKIRRCVYACMHALDRAVCLAGSTA